MQDLKLWGEYFVRFAVVAHLCLERWYHSSIFVFHVTSKWSQEFPLLAQQQFPLEHYGSSHRIIHVGSTRNKSALAKQQQLNSTRNKSALTKQQQLNWNSRLFSGFRYTTHAGPLVNTVACKRTTGPSYWCAWLICCHLCGTLVHSCTGEKSIKSALYLHLW
jgi:hypothetical protein